MRLAFDRYWVAVAQVRRCRPTGIQRGMREPGHSLEFVSRYRIFGRSLIEIDTFWSPSYFSEGDYVYLAYRVENRMTLPLCPEVNGGAVTELKPGIGHRHVAIGDGHMARDTCAGGRDSFRSFACGAPQGADRPRRCLAPHDRDTDEKLRVATSVPRSGATNPVERPGGLRQAR